MKNSELIYGSLFIVELFEDKFKYELDSYIESMLKNVNQQMKKYYLEKIQEMQTMIKF